MDRTENTFADVMSDPYDFAGDERAGKWAVERGTSAAASHYRHFDEDDADSLQREIFVYDRKQLELNSKPVSEPIPKLPGITPFPDDLESETDMSSWRLLFKKRKAWAESVLVHTERLTQRIREIDAETKNIQRSVTIAFSNLETHSVGLGNSLTKLREWAEDVMDDREKTLNGWEPTVRQLLRIPVHEEFKKYGMDGKTPRKVNHLSDYFDIKEVQTAAATAGILAQRFEREICELGNNIEDICSRTSNLKTAIQQSANKAPLNVEEQLSGLSEEASLLVNKIRTDNEYARTLQGPKSASAASKRAYASTTEYLPGLSAVAADFGGLFVSVCERKVCSKLLFVVLF